MEDVQINIQAVVDELAGKITQLTIDLAVANAVNASLRQRCATGQCHQHGASDGDAES